MKRLLRQTVRSGAMRMLLVREWLEAGATFNPVSSKLRKDPYTVYRRLREKDPVHRSRLFDGWVLSKHAHVDAVLRDQHQFANDVRNASDSVTDQSQDEVHSMLYLDQPDHTRLRSIPSYRSEGANECPC